MNGMLYNPQYDAYGRPVAQPVSQPMMQPQPMQRLTSKLDQNKIEALQAQVSQLQLQNAMSGVVRFPSGYSYNAGAFPPFNAYANGVMA